MTATVQTVNVALAQRSYDILVGVDWLPELGGLLKHVCSGLSCVFVITDSQVARLHAPTVCRSLEGAQLPFHLLEVPAGESSKSIKQAEHVWQALLAKGADRQSVVVALGGGVVGDLAGFVAATYARGLRLVQVPTTLLAQVDSSVGGKVGINLPDGKNMVGCFWQPALVMIDIALLRTLPDREYVAGWGEVIKYGVILDADLFEGIESHTGLIRSRNEDALQPIITRCCQLKAQIVSEDERDMTGRRAILNYGHTFAHALESCTGYQRWLHGEAVAIGMDCAARLAERIHWTDMAFVQRQRKVIQNVGLPAHTAVDDVEGIWRAMLRDKKNERSHVQFVLPREVGHVELFDQVDPADVRWVWEHAE